MVRGRRLAVLVACSLGLATWVPTGIPGGVPTALAGSPLAATAATPKAGAKAAPTVLVMGDSLSAGYGINPAQGWVALLQQRMRQSGYGHQVVNASVSGETTGGALARLPRALAVHRPQLVILELGANDGLRALPPAQMQANLVKLVRTSRAAGAQVLLLGMRIPTNYGPAYSRQFEAVFATVARTEKVPLLPFFLEGIAQDPAMFQPDGLHPVARAQPRLLDNVWPALRPLLGRPAAQR